MSGEYDPDCIGYSVGDCSYDYEPWLAAKTFCPEHGKQADDCLLCKAEAEGRLTTCPECGLHKFIVGDGCYGCLTLDPIQQD